MALVPPIYGVISVTGTANEVEVTGTTRNVVVGLPNNVTIPNLTVTTALTGNEISATHFTGPLIGRVTAPCKNLAGTTLNIGTPVYISGYVGGGNSGIVEVKQALAASANAMPAVGLLETTLAAGDQGHIVINGILPQIDTTAYTAGQVLYVAPAGGLTATKPTGANDLIQNVGKVANVSANQGQIFVASIMRTNDVPNIVPVRSWLQMPNGQTATSLVTTFNGASGAVTYSPPLASASVTGVASFGNEFVINGNGAVGLTSNYVKSFNGATGTVTYSPRIASTSLTGVASFDSNYFTVSAAGAVSLDNGGMAVRASGSSTSGTAGTSIATLTAAVGKCFVAWNLVASHPNATNTAITITITYSDSTTDTLTTTTATACIVTGNAGGLIRTTSGGLPTTGTVLVSLQNKAVTKIDVTTSGVGTGNRAATISALEISQ